MLRKQSKLIAILLLLVFGQKVGLRLWMHHWLHEDKTVTAKSSPPSSTQWRTSCDCFDDAMMPMEVASTFVLTVPLPNYTLSLVAYLPGIPTVEKVFEARRGPPTQC